MKAFPAGVLQFSVHAFVGPLHTYIHISDWGNNGVFWVMIN